MFASRAENTCNALLCEELRKLGVEAFFEEHFLTQFGTRKPDIFAKVDKNHYFVEAKQRPRKLVDAVSKAYTYSKALEFISPKAAFAVLYPEDCVSSCEAAALLTAPPFYVSYTAKSLQDLASWIHSIITKPPVAVEISTSQAINLLREAVLEISEAFAKVEARDIEDIFGGKVFFDTVLGIKEEKEIPIKHLRDAASYLLVNQILFYQILAEKKTEIIRYKKIDSESLTDPQKLQKEYFSRVLLEDYKPIFGFDVASKIKGANALEAIKITVNAINALSPGALGHDILGKIFHELIPLDLRKVVAAFYTNIQAGEILATLAIDKPDALVLDPACGSGTLLVSSYQRKKDLLEKTGKKFGYSDHKRFVEEEITGIDIMPFAAHLAAVHLSLQAPLYTTDFVKVAIQDSTGLKPNMIIAPTQEVLKEAFKQRKLTEDYLKPVADKKEKVVAGVVELSEQANSKPIQLGKVDLVIMNPPFTRYQRIPPAYKTKLSERFLESRYQKCVHGQLGLHGYFLLLADRFLKENGRLAAVLPVTTLSAKGLYDIQDIWFKDYTIEYVIACAGRSAFSEDVRTREVLFVAKKGKTRGNAVAVAILKFSPDTISIAEARSLAHTLEELRRTQEVGITVDSDKYMFRLMKQSELEKSKRSLFRAISMHEKELLDLHGELVSLYESSGKVYTFGEFLNQVNGGIHESPGGLVNYGYYGLAILGNERKAIKKHDYWILKETTKSKLLVENRFTKVAFDIPRSAVLPNMRRPAGTETIDVTDRFDYVVVKPFNGVETFLKNAISGDQYKEAISRLKSGWWEEFVRDHSAHTVFLRRGDPTAPRSHCTAFFSERKVFSGAGGGLWTLDAPEKESILFTLWFNSSLNLFQMLVERKETRGGWMWFDDYVLREFVMPDFMRLSRSETEQLLKLQENWGNTLPSLLSQLETAHPVRKAIDATFLKILGMQNDRIDIFLSRLYDSLAHQLRKLKEVMAEGRLIEEEVD